MVSAKEGLNSVGHKELTDAHQMLQGLLLVRAKIFLHQIVVIGGVMETQIVEDIAVKLIQSHKIQVDL